MPPPSTIRLPGPRLTDFRSLPGLAGFAMDLFTQLFGSLLAFVYHCFDRIVIYGYLSGLSRPERVVNFFHLVIGVPVVSKEILRQRSADYQNWVEAFARNHRIPIEWAEKAVRKEDHVLPWQRRMVRSDRSGVYFILKSMEQGPTFRVIVPKYPTKDPNYRILARQRLHPLLFLHQRRNPRPNGDAGRLLPAIPDHVLPERPQLHRTGAEPSADRLPQERQCFSRGR